MKGYELIDEIKNLGEDKEIVFRVILEESGDIPIYFEGIEDGPLVTVSFTE